MADIHSRRALQVFAFALLFTLSSSAFADTVTLDFEGFPDSTILTTQYPGVTFSNAIILTVGISLNEFEFPPHSGVNVVSDDNGRMSITFSSPVTSLSGYFTYAEPLTLDALDGNGDLLTTANSLFSNNEALSGDPGSSPNEFIQLTSPAGVGTLTITGDPNGESFALDDLSYASAAPEPASALLFLTAAATMFVFSRRPFL